mgnify:CR=1 FL=1
MQTITLRMDKQGGPAVPDTWDDTQSLGIDHNGRYCEEKKRIYAHAWVTMLYRRNGLNTVNNYTLKKNLKIALLR